jgi:hypothetical protein
MMAQNARDDDLQLRNGQGVFMSIGHIQLWEPCNTHATSVFLRQTTHKLEFLATYSPLDFNSATDIDSLMTQTCILSQVPTILCRIHSHVQRDRWRIILTSILPQLCPLSKSLFLLHSKLLTNFSQFLCKPHNNSTMTSLTPLHDFNELTEQIEQEQLSLTLASSSPGFAFLF